MFAAMQSFVSLAMNSTDGKVELEATSVATKRLPPVMMHYMPWFRVGRYHWKEKLNWRKLLSQRRVASHFVPKIGPYNSVDRSVIRYHLDLMKEAGVEGIIVDWYGIRNHYDFKSNRLAADAIIEEASAKKMFFTICYEDWSLINHARWGHQPTGKKLAAAKKQLRRDLAYIKRKYASKRGFLKEAGGGKSGRPVMLAFGPRIIRTKSIWDNAFKDVFKTKASRPKLVSQFWGGPQVGDGIFSWFPSMKGPHHDPKLNSKASVLKGLNKYLDTFYKAGKPGTIHIGSILAGYHDYYKQGRGTHSHGRLPEYDGATMQATLAKAVEHQPAFVQVCTWNDFEEGTIVEPVKPGKWRRNPYKYLLMLQKHIRGFRKKINFQKIFEKYRGERKKSKLLMLRAKKLRSRKSKWSKFGRNADRRSW